MRAICECFENNGLKSQNTHFGNFKLPRQAELKPKNFTIFQKIIHWVGIRAQINHFLHFLGLCNAKLKSETSNFFSCKTWQAKSVDGRRKEPELGYCSHFANSWPNYFGFVLFRQEGLVLGCWHSQPIESAYARRALNLPFATGGIFWVGIYFNLEL